MSSAIEDDSAFDEEMLEMQFEEELTKFRDKWAKRGIKIKKVEY